MVELTINAGNRGSESRYRGGSKMRVSEINQARRIGIRVAILATIGLFTIQAAPPPAFSISVKPGAATIAPGATAQYVVSLIQGGVSPEMRFFP